MKSCPNCRTKFDPTFTMFCPECGTSVDPSVGSMSVPKPEPVENGARAAEGVAVASEVPADGPAAEALRRRRPASGGRLLRTVGIRVVVAVVFLAIGGLVGLFDDGTDPAVDVTFEQVETADSSLGDLVSASALAAGDCINWPSDDGETFAALERLDCVHAHDAEVYALVDHPAEPGAAYPGNDTVADWALQACYEVFEPYVGRSYEDSPELDYTFFTPTELGWRKYDDRAIQCLIFNVDQSTLVSSVRVGA
jgi:hypothetical protein